MKAFDLEKALAGEPFQCKRTKHKFYYLGDASKLGSELIFPIVLYNATTDETINIAIEHFIDENYGMYEELRPTVTLTLPCPLKKIEQGQRVYFLNQGNFLNPIGSIIFNEDRICDCVLFKNGGLFANKQDAQDWLDAMRNSRR